MTSSEKWAVDQPKEGTGKAGPIRIKTDDEEYMLLPYSDDRFVKLIFIDGVPLLPGSRLAVDAGCICDPERNSQGLGAPTTTASSLIRLLSRGT